MPKHYLNTVNASRAGAKAAVNKKLARRKFNVLYRELAIMLRQNGKSLLEIATYFNERGQKTRTGRPFSEAHVWRLLNRE